MSEDQHTCPACGLHYRDEAVAKECEVFCNEHNACSVDITKQSIEAGAIAESTQSEQ